MLPSLPIRVLMATCNGAQYLPEQLQSFLGQTYRNWDLVVGDDGSSDGTTDLVSEFCRAHPGRLAGLVSGPQRGAGANFLSLVALAAREAPGAALAFSDQDDVWLPDKLSRAAEWLAAEGALEGVPLAWSCSTILTDACLRPVGESRRFARPYSFGNALVQNILAGNTTVLSPAAAKTLAQTVPAALDAGVLYHDWWTYQVLTGAGIRIHHELEPQVLYRQHGRNLLGYNGPVRGRLMRLSMVLQREYAGWISDNLKALSANEGLLTPQARRVLRGFVHARKQGGVKLAACLPKLGLCRQSAQGDRMLRLVALSGFL